jgi:hypothetical protein
LYNYDFEIDKPATGWKITWQMFDRIYPAIGGIISWFSLLLVMNFMPYRIGDLGSNVPATLMQAWTLIAILFLMITMPTMFFIKGMIQGREMVLCAVGLTITGFLNLFNVIRLERAIDYFFISQSIPLIG